ncbi:MAG: hypothetical protein NPIRA05_12710 [Nitrospirales bacterium]|nr:MAG: hypothetical protein NPIRA05_12710 [Nitrospirales bacterium]
MIDSIQSGHIGTIAGVGEPGGTGDGGASTKASVNEPKNVAFDHLGNLYVIDSENHVIRKIDRKNGLIFTIAGDVRECQQATVEPESVAAETTAEPEDLLADLADNPAGAYEHTPDLSGTVRYWGGKAPTETRFDGDGGPASEAKLNFPSGIAIDETGVMYIADTLNHRIRKVDPATGKIQTIAGTGRAKWTGDDGPSQAATLNEPVALVIDGKGRLFVADQSNNRVRMIDTTTGMITTVAGMGEATYNGDDMPAIESGLAGPSGLALDTDGNLLIADTFNNRIRKVNLESGGIETVLGNGQAFSYQPGVNGGELSVARPYGIAFDQNGHLFITDSDNHLLRKWNPVENTMMVVAGAGVAQFSGDGDLPQKSSLNFPFGVAVDQVGNIAIADTFNHRIRLIAV